MSRLLLGLVALLSLAGSTADAQLLTTHAGGAGGRQGPLTITGIALSNNSFPAGAPAGTVVGAITAQTAGGSFGGNLSLSGTDAARFQITGSNIATAGVLGAGNYNVGVMATQTGAVGSPFGPVAFGITGATGSTWNPADKSPDITLSNGNLTASAATSPGWRSVRLTSSHGSGKYYFEVTAVSTGYVNAGFIVGLGNTSAPLNSYAGSDGNAYGFQCDGNGGNWSTDYLNSTNYESNKWDMCTAGNVLGFAVDLTAKKVWIANLTKGTGWNHGSTGAQDPASSQGGISIAGVSGNLLPMFSGYLGAQPGTAIIDTGSAPFLGTMPGGFSPWN